MSRPVTTPERQAPTRGPLTKEAFYAGKSVVACEWWLHHCDLPQLRWARLRVFDDGSADACWEDGGTLHGFESRESAGYFLAEDEYVRFDGMDEEDEREHGLTLSKSAPPAWTREHPSFESIGTC